MGHAVAFLPMPSPRACQDPQIFSSICGRARLREVTEGGRKRWWEGGVGGQLPKLTHIQSFWPEHLNIKTNQLQLTSKPVSRQQQELIKMKSFPLSPPLVLYCPNDMLACQVGWKGVHLTGPTIATSYITLDILLLYIKGIVFPNNHLFTPHVFGKLYDFSHWNTSGVI